MIDVHEEVSRALAQGVPVVALETTIITHGLPYPANIDAACQHEEAIRRERAVPAIIGVLHGRVRVGMSRADLEMLTRGPADKIQARSLPLAISRRASGGTTVSATLEIARHYGIAVFATGGIGGVHRHVERTGDVSEDLYALAHSPVAVVSSGAKAILDLPRTLEALESLGVAVIGYRTDQFPAFYHHRSGLTIPAVDQVEEIAAIMRHAWKTLGSSRGVLVCNPPPRVDELRAEQVERWIEEALEDADRKGITGKAVTPHLLAFLDRASDGATVRTNVALATANAALGAQIAVAYARTKQGPT